MKTSDQINELAAALAKAQGQFPTIDKTEVAKMDSDRAKYSYRYANLAGVLEAVRKPLSENGLSLFQSPHTTEQNRIGVTLLLMHTSGQYLEDTFSMPIAQQTPQGIGSTISYARRYQLLSCLGLATDDDDDGATAEQGYRDAGRANSAGQNRTAAKPKPEAAADNGVITEGQQQAIRKICEAHGWDAETSSQQWYSQPLAGLTGGQAAEMITKLNKSAKAAATADARN